MSREHSLIWKNRAIKYVYLIGERDSDEKVRILADGFFKEFKKNMKMKMGLHLAQFLL